MWILDQPIYVVVIGGLLVALLVYLALQSDRKMPWLLGAAGMALLTAVLLAWGAMVTTESERVRDALFEIAADVESNNVQAVVEHFHSQASDGRAMAASEMPRYDFTEVDIKSNLEIAVDEQRSPPEAEARFNVVVRGSDKDRVIGQSNVPRYVIVRFRQEDGTWKIWSYEHFEPTSGMRRR